MGCLFRLSGFLPERQVRSGGDGQDGQRVRDSIRLQDSIFVFVKGDTVRIEKYKYLYRDRVVVDTVYKVQCDTIRVPYPVEKPLTRWQKWKLDLGGFAMAAIAITVLVVVGRMVYKLKK